MAEELQSLLDKINSEGVKKAQDRAAVIVAEAEQKAKDIVAAARAEAEQKLKQSAAESEALQKRGESAVRQAARDIALALQNELKDRISAAVEKASAEALTPEFMTALITRLCERFAADPDAELSVRAAVKDCDELEKRLLAALKSSFKNAPEVLADPAIRGGFEVGFKNDALYFDFTVDAVTGLIREYVGGRLGAMISE